jgi:CubicO group peptidase (beta-lactamase class C family)
MGRVFTSIALAAAVAVTAPVVASASEFPPVDPERVGLSSEALAELAAEVERYVDRDMAVGAELLVIKDRQTVLHEAFGWRDREAELPMERDTLFNIRSMTKPITGAAAQVLIDEGRLALDDRVSDYLPGFDTDDAREITVEQLLTHTSGLPLTTLETTHDFDSLESMANAIGEGGPEFEPGSRFWYSDAGADTLGAVVEQASGSSLEDFVRERLLDPLGMDDTYHAGDPADPRLDRTASLYVGRVGEWTRFWTPEGEPFYPFAWGSQSLYGTAEDYARLLAMWMDDGEAGGARILSPEAVSRTLTPVWAMGSLGSDAPYPTQFPDMTVYHGQMALMHVPAEPVEGRPPEGARPEIVGYSGSDGTIAWAFPERDLIVLYFTQSRGGSTPIRLEAELQRLLLDPVDGPVAEVPVAYGDFLGTYTANFGPFVNEAFEVVWRDGELALDIPSQFVFVLDRVGEEERWAMRGASAAEVTFARDDAGVVTDLRIHQGGNTFDVPRGEAETEPVVVLREADVAQYLGWFREVGSEREVEVVLHEGALSLRIPEAPDPLALRPPDEDGAWRVRMSPSVGIYFEEQDGVVDSYVARGPGAEATFERIEGPANEAAE